MTLLLSGCIEEKHEFKLDHDYPCKELRKKVFFKIENSIKNNELLQPQKINDLLAYINLSEEKAKDCLFAVFSQSKRGASQEVKQNLAKTLSVLGDIGNVLAVNPKYCDLADESCIKPYLEKILLEN